jgi:2-dehydropantoate 2-reductase
LIIYDDTGDLLIVGAGAIGAVTAAKLYQKNVDVTLLNRKGSNYQAIKKNGVIIDNQKGVKVPIYTDDKEINRTFDHVMIAVKNPQTKKALQQIKPLISDETLVYSMQNGLGNTDIMAQIIPRKQIVAGVVGWGSTYLGSGTFRVTSSSGDFILGFEQLPGQKSKKKITEMKKMLDNWKPTIITNNIEGFRWSKLIVNSIIAPLGGLLGITVGSMFQESAVRAVMTALKEEGLQLATKMGISLEKVDGMDIRNFFYRSKNEDSFLKRLKRTVMSRIINYVGAKRHGKIHSSLLTDLKRGIKTEIEFLNGYLVERGKELGLDLPVNTFLTKAINEIEDGERTIGLHNLTELEAIVGSSPKK